MLDGLSELVEEFEGDFGGGSRATRNRDEEQQDQAQKEFGQSAAMERAHSSSLTWKGDGEFSRSSSRFSVEI